MTFKLLCKNENIINFIKIFNKSLKIFENISKVVEVHTIQIKFELATSKLCTFNKQ